MPDAQRQDKAIVTLAIGEAYREALHRQALPTWRPYAEKHGYDLIVLTEPLDPGCDFAKKSIHWQKLLLGMHPRLKGYRHLVWLDGDILINATLAPCIVSQLREGRIGVVDKAAHHHVPDEVFNLNARYLILNLLLSRRLVPGTPKTVITDGDLEAYYRLFGLEGRAKGIINTGVMAFSPEVHGEFLAGIYLKYDHNFADFEQTPVSFELQNQDRAEYLDDRFNTVWAQVAAEHYPFLFNPAFLQGNRDMLRICVNVAFRNAWFLHFAGASANPVVKGAFDLVDPDLGSVPEIVFPEFRENRDAIMEFHRLADWLARKDELVDAAKDWKILL